MRVLHVVPGAFDYFDDIRQTVFSLMDDLEAIGIEGEAFVLEYGPPKTDEASWKTPVEKASGGEKTPAPTEHKNKRTFQGTMSISDMLEHSDQFDVLHLHVPLFGGGHALSHWRKHHPERPFVVTYHRAVKTPDFFSLLISWYNAFYLGRLARLADIAVSVPEMPRFIERLSSAIRMDSSPTVYGVSLPTELLAKGLTPREIFAWKYAMVYTALSHKEQQDVT